MIAVGFQAAIPPIPGLADVDYWTTHEVIGAAEQPGHLVGYDLVSITRE